VRDSIRTGAGYAGYVIAIGFALTAAGLDFSNIAIIAGALGVGIGFGLQSIVNNFVSGLILLAERPVRVGDWIKIGNDEGVVKKINVRSTEIETFDKCAVIVPNSNFVTLPVRNWTYADTMGQFLVQLQISYKSPPEVVRDLLLRLAREHGQVLTYPAPSVTLAQLSASGMSFELRGHVADVFAAGGVASDLRFAIHKAFAGEGIELAIPLQDVRFLNAAQPPLAEGKPPGD
jgi:small-conductance mechanosensitive channel